MEQHDIDQVAHGHVALRFMQHDHAIGLRHRAQDTGALRPRYAHVLAAVQSQAEVIELSLAEPAIEDLVRRIYLRKTAS